MRMQELNYYYNKFKYGEDVFHNLMQKQIKEILLVSTFYDAFIFEQDGRLSELIFGEYRQLNLSTAPRITSVPSGKEALIKIGENNYDLVILMMRIGEITPFELSRIIKKQNPHLPIFLLLNVHSDFMIVDNHKDEMGYIDDTFIWNGDTKLFLAMVKNIEDKMNVAHDTEVGLTRVILLVEDSVHYYSAFLPMLYSIIMKQTQKLIQEELTDINKRLRMRARPKVLLVHSYEEAIALYEKYKEYIVCVISDVKYFRKGLLDKKAGIQLIKTIIKDKQDIPIILQSSDSENKKTADKLNVQFINKNSKHLLHNLREFIIRNLGFGDFIFRNSNNDEIARAATMREFEEKLEEISDDSLLFHSNSNHFSNWLIAHGEVVLAKKIRPMKVEDFKSVDELRSFLLKLFEEVRREKSRGKIINFNSANLSELNQIIRMSDGSLGGKGRGLAFLNALLVTMDFEKKFKDVNISLPSTAIIGTHEYDTFIDELNANQLRSVMEKKAKKIKRETGEEVLTDISLLTDEEIDKIFIKGNLTEQLIEELDIYLDKIHYPIAVRSSGLLEDSQSQPFAGVYRTYMLPNNHPDKNVRVRQLREAIKLVFASVFLKNARNYIEGLNYKTDEEKMAVIIQEIVGSTFNGHYYPHISGAAQSFNFYPTSYTDNKDGIASIVLGMGKAVVEGQENYRFCPKYPQMESLAPNERIKASQKDFYVLNVAQNEFNLLQGEDVTLKKLSIKDAEKDGTLNGLVTVWDYQNARFVDSIFTEGLKVLTFPGILKYNTFPLAEILQQILDIGEVALGSPVEIEFAVNLNESTEQGVVPTFYILQIRPLLVTMESFSFDSSKINKNDLMLFTEKAMGNGIIEDINDVIFVDHNVFDKTNTVEIQQELEHLNEEMKREDKEYILIGPGRWGSRDRFLGVPVRWAQINKARVIVETGLEDFVIEASQGTHFFHNIVAMQVGYFTIPYHSNSDFVDWKWLHTQKIVRKTKHLIHVRTPKPLTIRMDGKKGIAVIDKK